MDQREQLPLAVDLGLAAQCEPVQSLVVSDVAEHRFDHTQTLPVTFAAVVAVDALTHSLAVADVGSPGQHGNLSTAGGLGVPQTLPAQFAAAAGAERGSELDRLVFAYRAVLAVAVQALPRGAGGVALVLGDDEVAGREDLTLAWLR